MIDNVVLLGVSGATSIIFKEEFPQLKKIEIEPYRISYSKRIPLALKLFFDAPRIVKVILKEHEQLKNIIQQHGINLVISDNRFGLYHKAVETVYITHQLTINAGIFSWLSNSIHHWLIKKFNHVWVPDNKDMDLSLACMLSRHPSFPNALYLGVLSRLNASIPKTQSYDILILLSGVEPHRTLLEVKLIEYFKSSTKKICLVRGTNTELILPVPNSFTVIGLPTAQVLSQCIQNSDVIVCRSGYSTLMDLYVFKKTKLILIPTPGQTEQLYLANYWKKKFGAKVVLQNGIQMLML